MKNATLSISLRSIAIALSVLLLVNQLADAAMVPRRLPSPASQATQTPAPVIQAPASPAPGAAPLPASIATAHTVFLSNMGGDANFPGSAQDAYNAVYTALQGWGRYQLVSSPEKADLIFQLNEIAPITDISGVRGSYNSYTSPAFQLTIVDPKTSVALWTVTSPVTLSYKKRENAKWIALGVTNLVSRVKVLAGQSLTAQESADLTTAPKGRSAKLAYLLVGGFVLAAVGGGLLMKHEFDNSVADQNAALCKQNPFFCTNPGVR